MPSNPGRVVARKITQNTNEYYLSEVKEKSQKGVNKISLQEICDIIYSDISVSQYLVKGKHLKGVTENYFVSCCRGKEGQLNGMDPQGIRSNDPDKEGR